MSKFPVNGVIGAQTVLHITTIREVDSPTLEDKRLPASVVDAGLPAEIDDDEAVMCAEGRADPDGGEVEDSEDMDRSVQMSSLAWEPYELSSDLSKSLKGDHGILAALDLSLPLPMCNVDLSSPTKPRDILDIFGEVMDLPPLNNFLESRADSTDANADRSDNSADVDSISQANSIASTNALCVNITPRGTNGELDRSNTLMTPQELERMPDQGLEFEQSVGPKESPQVGPPSPQSELQLTQDEQEPEASQRQKEVEYTSITVVTSMGEKSFRVNTDQLRQAAALMQPIVIRAEGESSTLVMMPVSKQKILPTGDMGRTSFAKFKCLHCDKTFERSYKLRIHEMMKHSLEKPFKCPQDGCKWAFSNGYRLKNHLKCHLKIREHQCDTCKKKFTSYWNLRAHIAQLHDEEKLMYRCELCGKGFAAETKLYKHTADEHPEQPKQFKCDEEGCTAEFHSKLGLMRHIVGHKKRKALNLVCPVDGCGQKFDWKSRYDLHMRSHLGDAKYKCTFQGCNKSFVNVSVLNRHYKMHTRDGELKCPSCVKTFYRKDHLKSHISTAHSTHRPFICTEPGCGYTSSTKNIMDSHLKRHALKANRARLVCPDQACETTVNTMTQLLKHINAYHPNIVEVRYAKELEDMEQASEESSEQTETLMATKAVAEQNGVELDWNVDGFLSNQQEFNQTMAVMNTEVAGKSVELILPTSVVQSPTVSPAAPPAKVAKMEKGSARTDSVINTRLCAQARARQERQQKEQEKNNSLSEQSHEIILESTLDGSTGQYIVCEGSNQFTVVGADNQTVSVPVTSGLGGSLLVSSAGTSIASLPSSVQWYTSSQEGVDEGERSLLSTTDMFAVSNPQVLDQLTDQIDSSAVFTQLYDSLE